MSLDAVFFMQALGFQRVALFILFFKLLGFRGKRTEDVGEKDVTTVVVMS